LSGGLTEQYGTDTRAAAQFPTLLIAANAERHALIQESALATHEIMLMRSPAGYPHARELVTVMNHAEPELVLLDLFDPARAEICSESLRERFPSTPVIGIGVRNMGEHTFVAPFPPTPDQLARLIHKAVHAHRGQSDPGLLVFIPAKAGCGSSTVALNTAGALAQEGKRVLLIDTDLHSGSLGSMVRTSVGFSLQQVLRGISELDRFRFEQAVCQAGEIAVPGALDLLVSDGTPVMPLPCWEDYFRILDIAKTRYEVIVADLPELVNAATQEFVQRAQHVYIVATQELIPLKLASRRMEELAAFGTPAKSIRLVVNRWLRGEADAAFIQKAVGLPVDQVFHNDYALVRRALHSASLIPASSTLGHDFRDFACKAAGLEQRKGLGATLGGLLGLGRSGAPAKQTAG
jgi:Mrp family chromosome partitioning ATPase